MRTYIISRYYLRLIVFSPTAIDRRGSTLIRNQKIVIFKLRLFLVKSFYLFQIQIITSKYL